MRALCSIDRTFIIPDAPKKAPYILFLKKLQLIYRGRMKEKLLHLPSKIDIIYPYTNFGIGRRGFRNQDFYTNNIWNYWNYDNYNLRILLNCFYHSDDVIIVIALNQDQCLALELTREEYIEAGLSEEQCDKLGLIKE